MGTQSTCNFVKQQGFPAAADEASSKMFSALNFQPRVVGVLVLVALLLQSAPLFLALSVLLWWSALLPRLNPFDAVHNALFGASNGAARLETAPAPRRFSMGMAGSFMLGIGLSLLNGWGTAALVLQIFLVVALVALLFGKLCLGSYIFHLVRGRASFANSTLPWGRGQ
jgi:hypothetical protein